MSEVVYQPSRWAQVYHSLPYTEVLGAGAAGPGKTMCLLMDPLSRIANAHERCVDKKHEHALDWGGCRGWALHLRRTKPRLQQTIQRSMTIFPRIDERAKWNDNDSTWTFSSGYRLQFGHCKDPNDWEQFLGQEYDWIGFDELVEFEEEQYQNIILRLRSSDPVFGAEGGNWLRVRAMSNPLVKQDHSDRISVKNPHWVRDLYVKPEPEGGVVFEREIDLQDGSPPMKFTRMYLRATIDDNPNPQFVRQYKAKLMDAPTHLRQAMLYGNWFITKGSFFGEEWNERLHVCRPFAIPDTWKRFRAMDWGFRVHGCVLWFAMDPDGVLYCERELTFRGLLDEEVAKRIREIEKRERLWANGKSRISGPADKQLWEEKGESAPSKAHAMAALGVHWFPADQKSRAHNAERVAKRLKDHDNGTKPAGLIIFNTCKRTIETVPALQTDKDNLEEPQWGGEDHWYDALSYACAYAARGLAGIANPRPFSDRDKDDEDDDDKGIELERRGRYGRSGYGNRVL